MEVGVLHTDLLLKQEILEHYQKVAAWPVASEA
jgi:hypothetical protein